MAEGDVIATMLKRFSLILLLIFFVLPAEAAVYVVEPLLVTQPPAAGITFYVYRPGGLPDGWFVTFDGYAVTRSSSGHWVYGTMEGKAPAETNYTVGSANPSLLPIVPYGLSKEGAASAQFHEDFIPQPEGPFVPGPGGVSQPTVMPYWALDGKFIEVSRWNKLVDRMAMLDTPRAPIAWRGDCPKVIFAWTGRSWAHLKALSQSRPEKTKETLRYHLYSLTRQVHKSGRRWDNSQTSALITQSARWGYVWMGDIKIIDD